MKQIELFIAKKKMRLLLHPAKDIIMVKEQVRMIPPVLAFII